LLTIVSVILSKYFTMDLSLSEEQLMIQKAAREFAQQQCLPGVIERDEHQKVPKEQLLQLADLGFMGIMTPTGIWWCWNGYYKLCFSNGRNK
jgi:Acyl-CoA dehydrogenase, N-terminal domain